MNSRRASIDIGSNSILLLAGDFSHDSFREILNESNVTGLGRELDKNKKFLEISMKESLEVLKTYSKLVIDNQIDPSEVIVTATEAARVADNATDFFDIVLKETGFKVQVITSAAEAHYSTKGIMFNTKFNDKKIVIMDIGGASTEIIQADTSTGKIEFDFSMPFGAVRMTNWIDENTDQYNLEMIKKKFTQELEKIATEKIYCVAGTMTSVANMYLGHKEFEEKKIHRLEFDTSKVLNLLEAHGGKSVKEYLADFPFLGKRAKTITGGMIVATSVFNWLNIKRIEISTYGLRYGTLEQGYISNEYLA